MSMNAKLMIALVIAIFAGLILIVTITGQESKPILSPQGPKEVKVEKESPPGIEALREPGSEPTLENGVYHDPKLGYSIKVLDGWEVHNRYPGIFRSPDEEGLVGYADTKGMTIKVSKRANDAQVPLTDWFSQEEWKRYLVGEPQQTLKSGRPAIEYEADWGTLGHSISTLIAVDDQIFNIDCFYPRDSSRDRERCQDTLSTVLQTLQFDPQK